jgi:hypothetical protein
MPEENVEIEVKATGAGEEVYDKHAEGLKKVRDAQKEARAESMKTDLQNISVLTSLQSLNAGLNATTRGFQHFAGSNEAVNDAIQGFSAAMNIAIGVMQVAKGVSALLAATKWGEAAATVAASGWFAPVLAALIAGALAALSATQARWMATGGSGVVTEPTLFVAGEAGPEYYSFVPAGAGVRSGGSGQNIGVMNIYVVTQDPDRAGEVIVEHLRKSKEAGL